MRVPKSRCHARAFYLLYLFKKILARGYRFQTSIRVWIELVFCLFKVLPLMQALRCVAINMQNELCEVLINTQA